MRVDQNTIRFDFDAADTEAGANVLLSVDGFGGVTFAGEDTASYTTTLDATGNGSITVTADAATIQDGDGFDVDINGFDQEIVFERAEADSIDGESARYFCQLDAECTVTAVVKDQFGNPVTSGEVEARAHRPVERRHHPAAQAGRAPTARWTSRSPTSNAVNDGTDTVQFQYFVDQFDNTADLTDTSTTIKYTTTGQGNDYVISLDGENTEATDYEPADARRHPAVRHRGQHHDRCQRRGRRHHHRRWRGRPGRHPLGRQRCAHPRADRDHAVPGLCLGQRHPQPRRHPAGRLPDHRHQVRSRHADRRHPPVAPRRRSSPSRLRTTPTRLAT